MTNSGKQILIPAATILFIFVCLFLFFKFIGPIPFYVQNVNTTKESLFTVDGTGEVAVIPDTALISLGVTKTATTVEDAQNQVNTIANKITEELKKLGIDTKNIKTTNYSVNPQYDYNSGTQKITGYIVESTIQAKIQPIGKANDAIDQATKNGANQVGNIQFVVDDEKQKLLQKQAREKAITEAKEKAVSLADAAGIKLGRIVDVRESSQGNYPPYPAMRTMSLGKGAEDAQTEINPGENKITSTITLSYETY